MKKKILFILCIMIFTLGITGCGGDDEDKEEKIDNIISDKLSTKDLSIDDFDWSVDELKCYGSDCYIFKLTNNSKYDLIGAGIKYRVKDSATDEELKVFESFMKKHDGYIDEDDSPRDVTLSGDEDYLIEPGETIDDIDVTVGFKRWAWYDYPTSRQFSLMEPDELQLGVIYKNTLYIAYYNFDSKSWKFDTDKAVVDVWTKGDLGKVVEKPNCKHFIVADDEDYVFRVYAYGVTKTMYQEYVAKLKEQGFADDDNYTTLFDGKNAEGYNVYVSHDNSSESMTLRISPPDEN